MTLTAEPGIGVGTQVEVFSRFRQAWVLGFEIAAVNENEYALRRHTDWAVLPGRLRSEDVRVLPARAPAAR